jgi:hypothetical protein
MQCIHAALRRSATCHALRIGYGTTCSGLCVHACEVVAPGGSGQSVHTYPRDMIGLPVHVDSSLVLLKERSQGSMGILNRPV